MKVSQCGALGAIALFFFAVPGQETRSAQAAEAPLLPRELFFGAVEKTSPTISPDGRLLAYVAPTPEGAFNVWLTKADAPDANTNAKPLTHAIGNGIEGYRWAEDNTHILYWQDHDGDEKWHLYAADVRNGDVKDLTPFPQAKIQNLITSPRHPHEILVGLNKRDPTLFDMYRIDLNDGSMQLDTQNPGDVLSWTADQDFVVRAATAFVPDTGMTVLRVLSAKDNSWHSIAAWQFEQSPFEGQLNGGSIVAGFTKDARSLYAITYTGSDKKHLAKIDVTNGHEQLVAGSDCDIADDSGYAGVDYDLRPLVITSPTTGEPEAVAFDCGERVWHTLDSSVRTDLQLLQKYLHRFPYIASRNNADTLWIVAAWSGDRPTEYSLYDRHAKTLTPLFSERPRLKTQLRKLEFFQISARDGLKLPVYLTRPATPGPAPLILYPHGGPWDRDHDDYDSTLQLLVNRGYAVLLVEYRGSDGFGLKHFNAGNHEYGLKMRDDCIDAVEWAIHEGYADPKRVGVFGISAGGYLALRVGEARPDLFRAVVDVAGPTDVGYFLASMPKNWQAVKSRWVRRIGDAEHDEELNKKLSPQFDGTEPLQTSFLIAQGANDPRVNMRHADAIVAKLRERGAPVDYVVYLDEGHGLARPENNLDFYTRVEAFFAKTLGGRAEPASMPPAGKEGAQEVQVEVR